MGISDIFGKTSKEILLQFSSPIDFESEFFHDSGNFRFCFFYLLFDKRNLLNQCFELECEAVFGKGNAKRRGCGSL